MDRGTFEKRLASFEEWPLAVPKPDDLANSGLFYTGMNDITKCAYCDVEIGKWKPQDKPMEKHRRMSPSCRFVLQLFSPTIENDPSETCYDENDIDDNVYKEFLRRLDSFKKWPKSINQKAFDMAEAGFYYTGCEDDVRCFACNLELCNWQPNDTAWGEHIKYSRDCSHIKSEKTPDQIETISETTKTQHLLQTESPQTSAYNLH